MQWIKAASGVIHSEMPQQTDGLMRGFQLWINLPASEKMSDPQYQEFAAERIPLIERHDIRVKVIGGDYGGERGPISDPHTHVQYVDVSLVPAGNFSHSFEPGLNAFAYLFEGSARIADSDVGLHTLAVLAPGDGMQGSAGPHRARFILVGGRPLHEPIAQYGPFVMNTQEEVRQAFADYSNSRLVRKKASTVSA